MPVQSGYGFLGKEAPAAGVNTLVYTCPPNTTATIMPKVSNRHLTTPDPVTYWIIPTDDITTVEDKYLFSYKVPLPHLLWFQFSSIPVGSGQSIVCRSDNGTSSFHAYGAEEQQTDLGGLLGAGKANSSTYTIVYTAPHNTNVLTRIRITNTKTTTTKVRLAVIDGTDVSAVTDADHILYDAPLDPYNTTITPPSSVANQIYRTTAALGSNQSLIVKDDNDAASVIIVGVFE